MDTPRSVDISRRPAGNPPPNETPTWPGAKSPATSQCRATFPWRPTYLQALAGLAADAVTASILAVLAQTRTGPLLAAVFWSRAVLNVTAIALNALPVLEVDGHWALADYLDEPDLAPRARAALADLLHRRRPPAGIGLTGYGAVSLLAGFALIAVSVAIQWQVLGGLIAALVTGSVTDILIGCYLVNPAGHRRARQPGRADPASGHPAAG
jgi:hypothetical protein